MKAVAALLTVLPLCFLFGCTAPVGGPILQIMRPANKPMAVFDQEIASCQQYASQRVGVEHDNFPDEIAAAVLHIVVTPNSPAVQITPQQHYDLTYAQCMVRQGNILPGYSPPVVDPAPRKTYRPRRKAPGPAAPGQPPEFVEPPPAQ